MPWNWSANNDVRRAKLLALGLLLFFALLFALTHVLPATLGVRCLKAVSEAAMVGALADWFAVTALFRRIPLPWVGRHTDIIGRNKDRIGENLAIFVRDKFLDASSLMALVRNHDVAQRLADWLAQPAHRLLLGQQLARVLSGVLELVQDRQVERWLTRTLRRVLGQLDLRQSLVALLEAMTHDGKHQAVLDDVLVRISSALRQERTRWFMAQTIVQWLKREHPLKEKMLPTDWLGDKGADVVAEALDSVLEEVTHDPQHPLRLAFDQSLTQWMYRLQRDPAYEQRLEQVRDYLLHDEKLASYLHGLWSRTRTQLQSDLASEQSWVVRRLAGMGQWLGQSLAQDAALRASMNQRLERWAQALAPDVSQFIARHIQDTVHRWDARELSALVEQHIGKDLQFIRINGTLVGGAVGFLLFVITQLLS